MPRWLLSLCNFEKENFVEHAHHSHKQGASRFGLEPGSQVGNGRFRLKKLLGCGKIGEAWSAYDNRLREFVTLKFIIPQISGNKEAMEVLRRKMLKVRRLSHPNIVRVYDLHEEPNQPPFIAMEYVDGVNLHQFCLSRPNGVLTWGIISPLLRQLTSAIRYAHAENTIHRDIKPSNLLLDREHNLKITDFEIARAVESLYQTAVTNNPTSRISGFVSPQLARGEPATPSDDIYAIGATIYALITGTPPFYKGDIEYQILNNKPVSLSERLLELNVENTIPALLEDFVQACLEKDPSKRLDIEAISGWIDKIDREYEELINGRFDSSESKNESQDVAVYEKPSAVSEDNKLKSSLPFVVTFLFCIGLLVASMFMRKTTTNVKNEVSPAISQQTNFSLGASVQGQKKINMPEDIGKKIAGVYQQSNISSFRPNTHSNIASFDNIARGKLIAEFSSPLTAVANSEGESSWIIISDYGGWTRMLNTKSGSLIWEKRITSLPIKVMAMMSDNRKFIVGDSGGNIFICSVAGGEKILETAAHKDEIACVATSRGRYFASADVNGIVKIWDSVSGRFIVEIKPMQPPVKDLALSPDGKMLAAAKPNGVVNFYSLPGGNPHKSLTVHKSDIADIYFDSKEPGFYTLGKEDRTLKCWDLVSMSEKRQFRPQLPLREGFLTLYFFPTKPLALIVSDLNYGYIVDTETFALVNRVKFDIHTRVITDTAVLPDGTIITVGLDGFVCRWENPRNQAQK